MVTILVIACLTLLAGICLYIERSPVYPPFAMAACWAGFLGFHACSRSLLFPIHEETLFFFFAGVLTFCVSGLFIHFFCRPKRVTAQYDPARVKNGLSVFLLILCIALPFYVHFITTLVAQVATGDFWVILKDQLIEEHTDTVRGFSLMDNMVVLADITLIIAWYHRSTERWRAWAAFALFLLYNLLTAARAGFVFVLLSLFTIEVMQRRRIPWRPLAVFALVFTIAFFGLAILVKNVGASKDVSLAENVPALVEEFQMYIGGPLVAFDNLYRHPTAIPPTQDIDRNFKILANKIGFRTEIPYLHAEYSTVGKFAADINVYTIYFTYFPHRCTGCLDRYHPSS